MSRGVASESNDLGDFAPKGEPQRLNEGPGQVPQVQDEQEGGEGFYQAETDRAGKKGSALDDFSPIKKATKYSSLKVGSTEGGQKITIPSEGDGQTLANRKI